MAPFKSKTKKANTKILESKKFKDNINKYKNDKIKKKFRGKLEEEIDKTKLVKYDRGLAPNINMVKVKMEQKKIAKREKKIQFGLKQSVKSELLLTEESGYLIPDEGEVTSQFTQTNIKNSVDPLSASKRFDLDLRNFGPYKINYSRNGRFLLLGGRKGHVAALDWIRKKLLCEINVMESIHDVTWLHQETLYAVAQKNWVYVYDNEGTEIHCVKKLYNVIRTMFLPYHFLLATVSSNNFISWLDVSIGEMVSQFHLPNRSTASTVNYHPGNAMIGIGEPTGVVSFWGPNNKKAAISKLCHKAAICSLAFDPKGLNFVTAAVDRTIKLWDARNLNGPMQYYILGSAPNCITISQNGAWALGLGNLIEVYTDTFSSGIPEKKIYLRHSVPKTIQNLEFCPLEDILGVGHGAGFTSMLVPGCGEANFDALEINPFQTKSQRKEAEVKALLGKIPSDLITWDATELRNVDVPSMQEIIEAKKQVAFIKPPDIKFVPRKKKGKKSGSAKAVQRKNIVKETFKRNYVKEMKSLQNSDQPSKDVREKKNKTTNSVLDRFKNKDKN